MYTRRNSLKSTVNFWHCSM